MQKPGTQRDLRQPIQGTQEPIQNRNLKGETGPLEVIFLRKRLKLAMERAQNVQNGLRKETDPLLSYPPQRDDNYINGRNCKGTPPEIPPRRPDSTRYNTTKDH